MSLPVEHEDHEVIEDLTGTEGERIKHDEDDLEVLLPLTSQLKKLEMRWSGGIGEDPLAIEEDHAKLFLAYKKGVIISLWIAY